MIIFYQLFRLLPKLQRMVKYLLSNDQVKTMNSLLPKGYKLVTPEQYRKKVNPAVKGRKKVVNINPYPIPKKIISETKKRQQDDLYQPKQTLINLNIQDSSHEQKKLTRIQQQKNRSQAKVMADTPAGRVLTKLRQSPKYYALFGLEDKISISKIQDKGQTTNYQLNQLIADLDMVFLKAYEKYEKRSVEYADTLELQHIWNKLYQEEKAAQIKKYYQEPVFLPPVPALQSIPSATAIGQKRKLPGIGRFPGSNVLGATIYSKRLLGKKIKKLPTQYLAGVIRIVFENPQNKDIYEFDIDTLPEKKVRELQNYVDQCFQGIEDKSLLVLQEPDKTCDSQQSFFIISDDES